jgi:hypothetical protein
LNKVDIDKREMSRMSSTETTGAENRCMRCGRTLRVSTGYGPKCRAKVRQAVAVADAKPEQRDKALELITDGGIVPTSRPGVFAAVSSDGTAVYVADATQGTCTCKAGQHGRLCYHLTAAQVLTAAGTRRAA